MTVPPLIVAHKTSRNQKCSILQQVHLKVV